MTGLILGMFLVLPGAEAIRFSGDYAVFKLNDKLNIVEIYYAIPYHQLDYSTVHDTIVALYRVSIAVPEIGLRDSSNHRAVIPSFKAAQQQDMKVTEGFSFYALPGTYHLTLTVSAGAKSGKLDFIIPVRDLTAAPSLSDIEIASEIAPDTTDGPFTKQGLRVLPNPSRTFGPASRILAGYMEIYNLKPDSGVYSVGYRVIDDSGSAALTFPFQVKSKTGSDVTETFGVPTSGLKPGAYDLEIMVTDSSTGKTALVRKGITVSRPSPDAKRTAFSPEEKEFYREIQFWADQPELRRYQGLTDEGRETFLEDFWRRRDLKEFIARVRHADRQYRLGRNPGRTTDRGRIYITYGPPSDIETFPMNDTWKPLESWLYFDQGYRFLFIDLTGSGNYRILYTNHPREQHQTMPDWIEYVDPTVLPGVR